MKQQDFEERFSEFDEILTPWLENEEAFFAAVLLQTTTWWQGIAGERMELGLSIASSVPMVGHGDITVIAEHGGDDDPTFVFVPLPSLFQREYESSPRSALAEETHLAVQQQAQSQGSSQVEVLLTRFRVERAFLADFLREAIREELERKMR